ncbi:MAG TPA: SMP-30/gluconolactonase/LRE family protein [Polyangiaceae bacterium]|nr:SMP-30/gluconolactonase/LRE family protein [Polyangiaceae bacterium]
MKLRAFLPLLSCLATAAYACSSTPDPGGPAGTLPSEDPDSSTVLPDGAVAPVDDGGAPKDSAPPPPLGDGAPLPDGAVDPNPLSGVTPREHLSVADGQAMGLGYMDGLLWADGALMFTDPFAEGSTGHVWRLPRVGLAPAFIRPSGSAIGLCFDPDNGGSLVLTETKPSAVARRKVDGTARAELATTANGVAFNSPNDCVAAAGKGVYFTDPSYQGGTQAMEGVYRVAGTPPTVTLLAEYAKGKYPNGIALSADGASLFVSLTGESQLVRFALAADGTAVGAPTVFANTGPAPDGVATDTAGNVYVATSAGVEAFSSAGTKWGVLPLPANQQPTSLAFGDPQGKTLFVGSTLGRGVSQPAIYALTMRIPGVP